MFIKSFEKWCKVSKDCNLQFSLGKFVPNLLKLILLIRAYPLLGTEETGWKFNRVLITQTTEKNHLSGIDCIQFTCWHWTESTLMSLRAVSLVSFLIFPRTSFQGKVSSLCLIYPDTLFLFWEQEIKWGQIERYSNRKKAIYLGSIPSIT